MRTLLLILLISYFFQTAIGQTCRLDSIITVLYDSLTISERYTYTTEKDFVVNVVSQDHVQIYSTEERRYEDGLLKVKETDYNGRQFLHDYEYDGMQRLVQEQISEPKEAAILTTLLTYLKETNMVLDRQVFSEENGDTIGINLDFFEYDQEERLLRHDYMQTIGPDTALEGSTVMSYEGDSVVWTTSTSMNYGVLVNGALQREKTFWRVVENDTITRMLEIREFDLDTALISEETFEKIVWGAEKPELGEEGGQLEIVEEGGKERLWGYYYENDVLVDGYIWKRYEVDGLLLSDDWTEEVDVLSKERSQVEVILNDKGLIFTESDFRGVKTYFYSEISSTENHPERETTTVIFELDKMKSYFLLNGQGINRMYSSGWLIEIDLQKKSARKVFYSPRS